MVDVHSSESIDLMFKSRLKNLVVGLSVGLHPHAIFDLLTTSMPHLHALRCSLKELGRLLDDGEQLVIPFPSGLRYCDLSLASPNTPIYDIFTGLINCCAGTLVRLRMTFKTFGFDAIVGKAVELKQLTHLRFADICFPDVVSDWSTHHLREMTHLTYIECPCEKYYPGALTSFYSELFSSPIPFIDLRHCGIYVRDQLLPEIVPPLSLLHASLTSLTPYQWRTPQIAWLSHFTRLTSLAIDCDLQQLEHTATRGIGKLRGLGYEWPAGIVKIDCAELTCILATLTQLRRLKLHIEGLNESYLQHIVTSLVSLDELSLGSDILNSLSCLVDIPHVPRTLRSLEFSLPKLPPTKSTLLQLNALTSVTTLHPFASFICALPQSSLKSKKLEVFWKRFPSLEQELIWAGALTLPEAMSSSPVVAPDPSTNAQAEQTSENNEKGCCVLQ